MFLRVKRSVQGGQTYEYLQIVESYREAGRVRQRVRATLGRRDQLVASGALDALLTSLGRFSERFRVVERVRTAGLQAHQAKTWGPALVFGRLWETQDLPAILRRLGEGRRVTFDVERATFALALQRLCAPGSDLAAVWEKMGETGSRVVAVVEQGQVLGVITSDDITEVFHVMGAALAGQTQRPDPPASRTDAQEPHPNV